MISKTIEAALNDQIEVESNSSQIYLAMASWAEAAGLNGTAAFLYKHSDEEREHMLKLLRYVNERGGEAEIRKVDATSQQFPNIKAVFEALLNHETMVTSKINALVGKCFAESDYTTQNFLQWYVSEQIEEEALARTILDRLNLIGDDKGGLYLFDRDVENISVVSAAASSPK